MKSISKLMLVSIVCAVSMPMASASDKLANSAGCNKCHAQDKKLLGPSYKQIAAKYKTDPAAPAKLADAVRKGSKDVWGKVPMPPTPANKLSDKDLKSIIDWIVKS